MQVKGRFWAHREHAIDRRRRRGRPSPGARHQARRQPRVDPTGSHGRNSRRRLVPTGGLPSAVERVSRSTWKTTMRGRRRRQLRVRRSSSGQLATSTTARALAWLAYGSVHAFVLLAELSMVVNSYWPALL